MGTSNVLKAKVSSKGWVVIPASLRKKFGIKPGIQIEFREEAERIVLIPGAEDPVKEYYGKLAGKTSLTDALLEEKIKEKKREESRLRT